MHRASARRAGAGWRGPSRSAGRRTCATAGAPAPHQRRRRRGGTAPAWPPRRRRSRRRRPARSAVPTTRPTSASAATAFSSEHRPGGPRRGVAAPCRGTAPRRGCAPPGRAARARRPAPSAARTAPPAPAARDRAPSRGGTGSAPASACAASQVSPVARHQPDRDAEPPPAPAPGSGRSRKIVPADAPRQRSVAMDRARASSQARTPVATPMPPTSRAVSPARVRKAAARSRKRFTPGSAASAVRTRQPSLGEVARAALRRSGCGVDTFGQADAQFVLQQAAGLHQCGGPPGCRGIISARGPKSAGVATLSGSAPTTAAHRASCASPIRTRSPGLRPSRSATSGSSATLPGASAHRRVQHQRAIERIGSVHRLQLDQHPLTARRDEHRPHRGDGGHRRRRGPRPRRADSGAGPGAAAHLDIAAEDARAIRLQPGLDAGPQGADRGDGGDAERQAGQHDPQRPHAAAQFAPRQPQAERHLTERHLAEDAQGPVSAIGCCLRGGTAGG